MNCFLCQWIGKQGYKCEISGISVSPSFPLYLPLPPISQNTNPMVKPPFPPWAQWVICSCWIFCPSLSDALFHRLVKMYVSIYTTGFRRYKRCLHREPRCCLMGARVLPSVPLPFTHLAPYLSNYFHCPPVTKTQLTPLSFPDPIRVDPPEISPRYLSNIYGNEVSCITL